MSAQAAPLSPLVAPTSTRIALMPGLGSVRLFPVRSVGRGQVEGKTSKLKVTEFAALADPEVAARVVRAQTSSDGDREQRFGWGEPAMHRCRTEQADGFREVRLRVLPSPGQQMGLAEPGEAAGFQWPHGELAGDGDRLLEPRAGLVDRRAA